LEGKRNVGEKRKEKISFFLGEERKKGREGSGQSFVVFLREGKKKENEGGERVRLVFARREKRRGSSGVHGLRGGRGNAPEERKCRQSSGPRPIIWEGGGKEGRPTSKSKEKKNRRSIVADLFI